MAAPAFANAGAAAATAIAASINVPHPANVGAGDILVLLVLTRNNIEINTPAGWSQDATNGFRNQSAGLRAEWFWKRATGSEAGNLAVSRASGTTTLLYGRMYRFTGCPDSGDPFESTAQNGAMSATITPAAVATLGRDRLVVSLVAVADNNALGNFTG